MEIDEALARVFAKMSRSYIERKVKDSEGEWHVKIYFEPGKYAEAKTTLEGFLKDLTALKTV